VATGQTPVAKNSPAVKPEKGSFKTSGASNNSNSQKSVGNGRNGPAALNCPTCVDCGVNIDESIRAVTTHRGNEMNVLG